MASYRKRGKVWYYRYSDAAGEKHEEKGCPDRRVTEEIAARRNPWPPRSELGEIDPRDEAYRLHQARPLADHLTDWHAYLTDKGSTRQHALLSRNRATRIIELARARTAFRTGPFENPGRLKGDPGH